MLLGKRPRPPMKRTTSMSEISLDLNTTTDAPPLDPNRQTAGGYSNGLVAAALSPPNPNHTRHSADLSLTPTPDFLRSCSLCRLPLVPNRDIYMYRGDSAFCSLECRQQAMNRDNERKEKCSLASKKKIVAPSSAGTKVTSNGKTSVGAL